VELNNAHSETIPSTDEPYMRGFHMTGPYIREFLAFIYQQTKHNFVTSVIYGSEIYVVLFVIIRILLDSDPRIPHNSKCMLTELPLILRILSPEI
jgi:hypothetical protein